jgi:AraC-like DNA-binding protein
VSPGVSVAQAGAEVGYEPEAAFSRAFKKHVGLPPGRLLCLVERGSPPGGEEPMMVQAAI